MSDKDINQMDFKELRKEVQSLRDELAIMQRKYEDIFNNIEYEIPYINGKYTITEDLTLSGTVKWEMKNSPVKTQYSKDGTTWNDEQIDGYKYMRMSFDGGQTWTKKTQIVGEDGNAASLTFERVNAALGNTFKKAGNDAPTEITGSYVYSGAIYAGEIYGCHIYSGEGNDSYSEMTSDGLNVNVDNAMKVKIGSNEISKWIEGTNEVVTTSYPYITLGAGSNEVGLNKSCVCKLGKGMWIGDECILNEGGDYPGGTSKVENISEKFSQATGLFINFENNVIYQYNAGVPQAIGGK